MPPRHEHSLSRREVLQAFGQKVRFLLTAPIAYTLVPSESADAATTTRPQGEDMSVDDISGSNDPYRLPRHVIPTRYDLRLEPDLTTGRFLGQATILITVKTTTRTILLNVVDLVLQSAIVEGPNRAPLKASIELEHKSQRARLSFQETIDPGEWTLALLFEGTLNDQLRGFYRSTYKDASGITQTLAATQFEATDARRAFPCWDEPDFKAIFATTLVIDPRLTAVSNTTVLSESIEHNKKVVKFVDSINMSTYLVAFIVGRSKRRSQST